MACDHTTWLSLAAGPRNDHTFLISHRFSALIDAGVFPNPHAQTPSMVTFIGGDSKNRILRKLVSHQSAESSTALCNLHVTSTTSQNPLLVADCSIPTNYSCDLRLDPKNERCHKTTRISLRSTQDIKAVSTSLLSRLLGSFSDILCLFSADFGGFEELVELVRGWMRSGDKASTFSRVCRPNLVIIEERAVLRANWDPSAAQTFREMVSSHHDSGDLSSFFPSIRVLGVPSAYGSLMQHLQILLEIRRETRKVGRCLFSLHHFNAFLTAACHHWGQCQSSPFDFIQATRATNPVPIGLSEHLGRGFSLIDPYYWIQLAASSLILNSSPQGMHRFDSEAVFKRLYQRVGIPVATRYLRLLQYRYVNQVLYMESQNLDAVQLHRTTLKQYYGILSNTFSRLTCLCCLSRSPERGLPCGHTLCEPCIQEFGQKAYAEAHIYLMPTCPLCGKATSEFQANMKPPTAGVRILSIDGGGVRGVLPLQALRNLETRFSDLTGISRPIQEHFDLALGTSSGGLIVFGLFLNGWSVGECSKQFVRLAEKSFGKPRALWMSLLSDSRYGASDMEEALKEAFGTEKALLDWSNVGDLTTKVAVTATTTDTSSPCVFANYSGERSRSDNCGYKLITPSNDMKIPIWEAARCTTAAPSRYLPPHTLRNSDLGPFQDGGLKHNNPVNLARWESHIIWSQTTAIDIVLSMGTGTSRPKASSTRGWRGCCLARLYRSFMTSLDGQNAWDELQNQLPEKQKAGYFRLNIAFDGNEPALDSIPEMHRLKDLPITNDYELDIAESLVAKQFYFEFDHAPYYVQGRYQCSGYIRCRFLGIQQAKLVRYLLQQSTSFAIGDEFIANLHCSTNDVFKQPVEFNINDLGDEFEIWLTGVGTKPTTISGFPTSAAALMRNQGLDNPFGAATRLRYSQGFDLPFKRHKTQRGVLGY